MECDRTFLHDGSQQIIRHSCQVKQPDAKLPGWNPQVNLQVVVIGTHDTVMRYSVLRTDIAV